MATGALRDAVGEFFDRFVEAFGSFSGPRVAALYHVPGIALRGDGSIQGLQSRAEVEGTSRWCRWAAGARWAR